MQDGIIKLAHLDGSNNDTNNEKEIIVFDDFNGNACIVNDDLNAELNDRWCGLNEGNVLNRRTRSGVPRVGDG